MNTELFFFWQNVTLDAPASVPSRERASAMPNAILDYACPTRPANALVSKTLVASLTYARGLMSYKFITG